MLGTCVRCGKEMYGMISEEYLCSRCADAEELEALFGVDSDEEEEESEDFRRAYENKEARYE